MSVVSKGDVFTAGGVAKRFKVESVDKEGIVTLKETDLPDAPKKPEPETVQTTVHNLQESPDWLGVPD